MPSDQVTETPKLLIGICSCNQYKHRRDAVRETWFPRGVPHCKAVFFTGLGTAQGESPDTVMLNVPDDYDELPAKVVEFFRHSLETEDFDWLFKCDDDTYVAVDRLMELVRLRPDFACSAQFYNDRGYASGGAGYLISREFVEKLVRNHSLPARGPEDLILSNAVISEGADIHASELLGPLRYPVPRADNQIISCHWCFPNQMRGVHVALNEKPVETYRVRHTHWTDHINLFACGVFSRSLSECCGNWEKDAEGNLHLHWYEWGSDVVFSTAGGYSNAAMTMVQTLPNQHEEITRSVFACLQGGLGEQMFQYAGCLSLAAQMDSTLQLLSSDGFQLGCFGLIESEPQPSSMPGVSVEPEYTRGVEQRVAQALRLLMNPTAVIKGSFQDERFFQAVAGMLRTKFVVNRSELPEAEHGTPVCVDIRYASLTTERERRMFASYALNAMDEVRAWIASPVFLIFTDDVERCHQMVEHWPDVSVQTRKGDVQELEAMHACQAFILSDGCMAWWAAWLSGTHRVVQPAPMPGWSLGKMARESWATVCYGPEFEASVEGMHGDRTTVERLFEENADDAKLAFLNSKNIVYRCFNMQRRPDRRFVVERTAPAQLHPKLGFISAVDGEVIPRSRLTKWKIAPSGYAINLGKRLALRQFLKTDADILVLFEDDVGFVPGFMEKFDMLLGSVPDDWGMLFLGGGVDHVEPPQDIGGDLFKCRRVHYNHAWAIRRWCAKEIISALSVKPFRHPCSDQTIGELQKDIPTYAPKSWIAFQRRSASDNGFGLTGRTDETATLELRPWMHDDEIAVLKSAVSPGMRVLEWGAGGSTLLFRRLVGSSGHVDSIEHELEWVGKVEEALAREGCRDGARLHHVPAAFGSSPISRARPRQFVRYVNKGIELGRDACYDICFVDGRDRVQCALSAAKVLRKGALLFFHDFAASDRGRYRRWLPELLSLYKLVFEVRHTPQTMAVFERL